MNTLNNQSHLTPISKSEYSHGTPMFLFLKNTKWSNIIAVNSYQKTLQFCDRDWFSKIIDWEITSGVHPGVYVIGDYYVGSSKHIVKRIKQHVRAAINYRHYNKELQMYLLYQIASGEKIPITAYEGGVVEEYELIREMLDLGYPLVNKKTSL